MNARVTIALCLALLCGAANDSFAGQSPPERDGSAASFEDEVRALQKAVATERARLDELTARLDRLVTPAPAITKVATQVAVAETQPPRFDAYAETTLRFDLLRQSYDGCATCEPRIRERMRVRFGAEGRLAPGFRAVVGLGIGELNDPNSTFQTLGGNLGRKVTTWDRAFVQYRPNGAAWLDLTAGKFPYNWVRSSMTYDVDLYPEGASEKASFDLKHAGLLKNVGIQALQLIVNESASGPDTTIVGGQATARVSVVSRMSSQVAVSLFDVRRPESLLRAQAAGTNTGTRNTNAVSTIDGQLFYASGFRYVNAILENAVRTKWEAWPALVALEYQHNLRATNDRDTAASARFEIGRQQKAGDWLTSVHVFRVEQDAIVSALGESDWRGPSNVLQHRYSVFRMLHKNVQAAFTWYRGRTLDTSVPGAILAPGLAPGRRDPWASRMYFDVIYRY